MEIEEMPCQKSESVKYIFIYRGLSVGGAEMLMKNIAIEWQRMGRSVEILCETVDDMLFAQMRDHRIAITKISDWKAIKRTLRGMSRQGEELCIITFFWKDFADIYSIGIRTAKVFFYGVHAYALAVGNYQPPRFQTLLKKLACKKVVALLQSRNITCMDEVTVDYTMSYYPLPSEAREAFTITRVPVEIPDLSEEVLHRRANDTHCNILAVARADFPFKGYLLGLLRYFANAELDETVSLTIISYGEDEEQLQELYQSLPEEKRQRIQLIGKTDYRDLIDYIDRAKLYVGMGTTLLDASQRGLVSVPVLAYTNELIPEGFFYENFRSLGSSGRKADSFDALLRQVKNYTPEEYLAVSRRSRDCVVEHYGRETIARQLAGLLDEAAYTKRSLTISVISLLFQAKDLLKALKFRLRRNGK